MKGYDVIITTKKFIKKANIIHKNCYDYSKINYKNNKEKIEVICKKHGSFLIRPSAHILQKQGCRKCSVENKRFTNDQFLKKANLLHKNKYDYSLINYITNKILVNIKCLKHGIFSMRPDSHLNGQGCPMCGIERRSKKITLSKEKFIDKCKLIHKDKYDYSDSIYMGVAKKIEIKCNKCLKKFKQRAGNHLYLKQECPNCYFNNKSINNESFIKKATAIHNNIYDYSLINYIDCFTPVSIKCNKCKKIFNQRPSDHLNGHGCKFCHIENQKNTINEIIERSIKTHGDKYDYSLSEYTGCQNKIKIRCKKCNHVFKQLPYNHFGAGHGCPKCFRMENSKKYISKSEMEFLDYVKIPNTKENRQFFIKNILVDGIDNKNNVYEFLGDYWHGNPKKYNHNDINKVCNKTFKKLYDETVDRFIFLKENGYNVKYIWESDWEKFRSNKCNILNIKMFNNSQNI